MDTDRLPSLAIWTRISCDALLLVGGAIMTWGTLFTGLHPYFFPYGALAAAVVAITAYSRKRRSRKTIAYLLVAIQLYIVAITLLVASWGKISPGVLIDLGVLAAWPTLALLWLFLDHRATSRIDRLTSVDQAEKAYRRNWKGLLARVALSFMLALLVPAFSFYCATLIPALITQVNSHSWPQAQGMVMLSEIRDENISLFEGRYNLVYRYQVDGKTYRGTRYTAVHPHLIENCRNKQLAEELKVGSSITVHYRKTDPTQSLLQTGIDSYILLLLLGMLVYALWSFSTCFYLYDGEHRFLLSPEKYKLFNTPARIARYIWLAFSGIVALFVAGGFLVATDYAPTQADALAAWGITLAASYLIYCWIHRKTAGELAEGTPVPQRAICKA